MSSISENVARVKQNIAAAAESVGRDPAEITLLAATKTHSAQTVREAIAAGITVCGENRVQEMLAKIADGAYAGADLHFIGHLQTNKVKDVVGKASLIHSVDSLKLAETIDNCARRNNLIQNVLIEVNIGQEKAKSGFDLLNLTKTFVSITKFQHIRVLGLMCIPPVAVDLLETQEYFEVLTKKTLDIRSEICYTCDNKLIMSFGMSGDYELAVRCGSTMVRVGSAIFGHRNQGER